MIFDIWIINFSLNLEFQLIKQNLLVILVKKNIIIVFISNIRQLVIISITKILISYLRKNNL